MVVFFFHTFISFWDSTSAATKLKHSWLLFRGQEWKGCIFETFEMCNKQGELKAQKSLLVNQGPFQLCLAVNEDAVFSLTVMEIPSQAEDCIHS